MTLLKRLDVVVATLCCCCCYNWTRKTPRRIPIVFSFDDMMEKTVFCGRRRNHHQAIAWAICCCSCCIDCSLFCDCYCSMLYVFSMTWSSSKVVIVVVVVVSKKKKNDVAPLPPWIVAVLVLVVAERLQITKMSTMHPSRTPPHLVEGRKKPSYFPSVVVVAVG